MEGSVSILRLHASDAWNTEMIEARGFLADDTDELQHINLARAPQERLATACDQRVPERAETKTR